MIRIEFSGNTTKEVLMEIIKMAELVKGTIKVSKPLVETREEVIKEDNLSGKTPLPTQEVKTEVKVEETPWEEEKKVEKPIDVEVLKEKFVKTLHSLETDEKKANLKAKAKEFLTTHGVKVVSEIKEADRVEFLKLLNENSL